MNLIVEFDLDPSIGKDGLAEFIKFLEAHPNCNGTYTYENGTPPMPYNGRASFTPVSAGLEFFLNYLFGQLQWDFVRSYEIVQEAPAVL